MAKRRRLPDLANEQRCTRNGTKWRCHLPRLPNKCFCRKHHALNLARSQSKSKSKPPPDPNQPQIQPQPRSKSLREIWAFHRAPDDPHLVYARIERLVPSQPLVEVTPLIPPSADVACGLFRAADSTEVKDMGLFSHRVCFEMEEEEEEEKEGGERQVVQIYKIYPKKGEVWAVEVYGWVEMVSGFGEGEGASGAVLVEEEGEAGFYRRLLHEGCELIRRFSMEEVSMFLHRVSDARVVGGPQGMLEYWRMEVLDSGASREEKSRRGKAGQGGEANGTSTQQRITGTQQAEAQVGNPHCVDGTEGGRTGTEDLVLGGLGNPQAADSTGRGRSGRGRGSTRGRSITGGRRGKVVIPRGRGGTRKRSAPIRSTVQPNVVATVQPNVVADHESGQTSEPMAAQPINQSQTTDNQQNFTESELKRINDLYQIFKF